MTQLLHLANELERAAGRLLEYAAMLLEDDQDDQQIDSIHDAACHAHDVAHEAKRLIVEKES